MSLFKEKVTVDQLVSQLILMQVNTFDQNFDALLAQAGEQNDLTEKQKELLKSLLPTMIVANLSLDLIFNFPDKFDGQSAGKEVASVYVGYLTEELKLSKKEVDKRSDDLLAVFEKFENKELGEAESMAESNKDKSPMSEIDQGRFALCQAFSHYFNEKAKIKPSGEQNDPTFPPFHMAMAIAKSDVIKNARKEVKVTF